MFAVLNWIMFKHRKSNTPAHPFCPNKNNKKKRNNYRSRQEIELELRLLVASNWSYGLVRGDGILLK
jgi:hypothetical protein